MAFSSLLIRPSLGQWYSRNFSVSFVLVYVERCGVLRTTLYVNPGLLSVGGSREYSQGRNMVYSGPIDPYFLAVMLIPEPHFPQNLDP